MTRQVNILYEHSRQGRRLRFSGNPLVVLPLLFVLIWFVMVIFSAIKLTQDSYFPYQGEVLKIETRWYDHIPFEFLTWEHLMIETPQGKTIDKFVSKTNRLSSRITSGDYVIKPKGFNHPVRCRDKKTTQEILDAWNARKKSGS